MANSGVRVGKRRNYNLPLFVVLATNARCCEAFDLANISNISTSATLVGLSAIPEVQGRTVWVRKCRINSVSETVESKHPRPAPSGDP